MLDAKYEQERAAVKRVSSLLEPLRAATRSPTTDLAYIVKGVPNVLARAQAIAASARREIVLLASDEPFFRKLEADLAKAARRRVKLRIAVPDIALDKDLERFAKVRSIVCSCMILVADRQQVFTVARTSEDSAYGITSTDETLVTLGLEYWESPRCCVGSAEPGRRAALIQAAMTATRGALAALRVPLSRGKSRASPRTNEQDESIASIH